MPHISSTQFNHLLNSAKPASWLTTDLRRLVAGQAVSGLGDWMGTFALMAAAYGVSGSASAVGGILALRLLPAMLGGALAVRLATQWGLRRSLLSMEFLRLAIIAAVPLVAELWWIYAWAFLLEAASIIFLAARDAAVPQLVSPPNLPQANSWLLGSSYGTMPLGAGLFAAIAAVPWGPVSWFDSPRYALVFWLDALTFLVSAGFIAKLVGLRGQHGAVPGRSSEPTAASDASSAVPDPTRSSPGVDEPPPGRLRDAWQIPLVRRVLPAALSAALGLGALFSLGISLVQDELDASAFQFAVLIILFGLGAVAGLLAARRIQTRHLAVTRRGVLAMGIVIATMSLSPYLWLTFLGAVGFGSCVTISLVSGLTALQQAADGSRLVAALASFHVVIRGALAVSALVTGAVADLLGHSFIGGTRLVLLAAGMVVIASAVTIKPESKARPERVAS